MYDWTGDPGDRCGELDRGDPRQLVTVRRIDACEHHPAGRAGARSKLEHHGCVLRRRFGARRSDSRARSRIVRCVGPGRPAAVALILAVLLVIAAAIETGWLRIPIPSLARQVNEDWLDQYRGWVIGFGFGYQLGLAAVVYITTASLWVVFIAEFLTFSPIGGLALGALFGFVRSIPIFATRRVRSTQELRRAHTTMHRLGPVAERTLSTACGVAAVVLVVTVIV